MQKKSLLLMSLTGASLLGLTFAMCISNNKFSSVTFGSDPTWNHYQAVAATCESYGVKEYWTNCQGSTTIVDPGAADVIEKGQPSAAEIQAIVDTYGSSDERIIAKAAHSFANTLVTSKIGYFGTVCSVCGESGELSGDKMLFADIDFTKATYDAQGGKWGTNVQPTAKTMTYEVTEGSVENEIKLPKINFSVYKTISFTVSGNDWSARAGLQTGSYAFPYAYRAEPYSGTLTFTTVGAQVNVAFNCAEGTNQNLVISDSDIVNGNKSFSMFMIADSAYRSISIELTALTDICTHNFVANSNCIGKEICSLCGSYSDDVIAFADVDFTVYQYGAQGGKWGTNVQPTAKTMTYEVTEGSVENEIKLPKIDFSVYKTVSFAVSGNVWDARVGIETGSYAFPYDGSGVHSGTLTFTTSGAQVNVAFNCAEGTNQNLVISDSDIINGNKSFSMFMIADAAYRAITIELTSLIDTCTHNFVADSNCIGKEVCSICHEARGMASPSFDFTSNLYGAYDYYGPWDANQGDWVRADDAGQISLVNYTVGDLCALGLPRMYFAGFSSITIDVMVNYGNVIYSLDQDFTTSYTTPFAGYTLHLVFENITSSSMTVKILDAFSTMQVQATCTDANVLNGLDNFVVYTQGCGSAGWDAFSNFTFTA